MTWSAYVFGDLKWPMPDLGLVAVWRAMPIDASKWGDWDGFVDGVGNDTIASLLDGVEDRLGARAPFALELDENGAKLRAYLHELEAEWWQRLAIAWRAAADLGASGEFVWAPGRSCPFDVAYHGVIGDYDSRWQKCPATVADQLAGRKEIEALLPQSELETSAGESTAAVPVSEREAKPAPEPEASASPEREPGDSSEAKPEPDAKPAAKKRGGRAAKGGAKKPAKRKKR